MAGARNTGGRDGGRAGWSGRERQRPHRDYSEYWLERRVRGLYQAVVAEPVPQTLLDIVERLPLSQPAITDALRRARRFRAKAEELETAAESMRDYSARQALLQLAQSYRTLAQFDEGMAQRLSDQKRGAG